MIVMKFGGTSVGSRERLEHVGQLVARVDEPVIVVVSAMGGTTDQLLDAGRAAEVGELEAVSAAIEAIRVRHHDATDDVEAHAEVDVLLTDLTGLLRGVSLLREQTPRSRALLASFGERLSVPLAASWVRVAGREARPVDAREIVATNADFESATVDMEATRSACERVLRPMTEGGVVPVITGFVGRSIDGTTTVLGRGGSDYSAALFAGLLRSRELWIWTDVPGILTADPRLVKEARTLDRVSYREAAEMSYFGAKVVHPKTMLPVMDHDIPIRVLCTFDPDHPGTVIARDAPSLARAVKTVSTVRNQALVTVEGRGMAGMPGMARRIFSATERAGANVVMISQASSEQTVSFVVSADDVDAMTQAMEGEFALEMGAGLVDPVGVKRDVTVLSIIGQGMSGRPGVSARLFGALGSVHVNVLAIAQGASELSISVAVDQSTQTRAVRAVHTAFGLTRVVNLVLIGAGRVGQSLLGMLNTTRDRLAERRLDLRLVCVANSRRALLDADGLDPDTALVALESAPDRPDDATLVAALQAQRSADVVIVDVTAADTAALHLSAIEAGFNVVTANKRPLSGPLLFYKTLEAALDYTGAKYGYETTFGAGLPVLHTLKELVHTGDELSTVTGCFSGTLGFLCTQLQEGNDLSEAVNAAEQLGYTEPDPREDLSGRDVGRKALIIARAMGLDVEWDDVLLEPFVPGLDAGLKPALEAYRGPLADRIVDAETRGMVLRYVAEISLNRVWVGLKEVPANSPIGALFGPDNILVFRTARYRDNPLVIRGPGAGAEVTAAGVLGDILKIARL